MPWAKTTPEEAKASGWAKSVSEDTQVPESIRRTPNPNEVPARNSRVSDIQVDPSDNIPFRTASDRFGRQKQIAAYNQDGSLRSPDEIENILDRGENLALKSTNSEYVPGQNGAEIVDQPGRKYGSAETAYGSYANSALGTPVSIVSGAVLPPLGVMGVINDATVKAGLDVNRDIYGSAQNYRHMQDGDTRQPYSSDEAAAQNPLSAGAGGLAGTVVDMMTMNSVAGGAGAGAKPLNLFGKNMQLGGGPLNASLMGKFAPSAAGHKLGDAITNSARNQNAFVRTGARMVSTGTKFPLDFAIPNVASNIAHAQEEGSGLGGFAKGVVKHAAHDAVAGVAAGAVPSLTPFGAPIKGQTVEGASEAAGKRWAEAGPFKKAVIGAEGLGKTTAEVGSMMYAPPAVEWTIDRLTGKKKPNANGTQE